MLSVLQFLSVTMQVSLIHGCFINLLRSCLLIIIISLFQSLLGEFNKEQEAFIKDKQGKTGDSAAVPPWVGWPNEENLKEECLALSTVSNVFLYRRSVFF